MSTEKEKLEFLRQKLIAFTRLVRSMPHAYFLDWSELQFGYSYEPATNVEVVFLYFQRYKDVNGNWCLYVDAEHKEALDELGDELKKETYNEACIRYVQTGTWSGSRPGPNGKQISSPGVYGIRVDFKLPE